jgi:uncharacterized protein involved in exopolysaccharide biosynthesis
MSYVKTFKARFRSSIAAILMLFAAAAIAPSQNPFREAPAERQNSPLDESEIPPALLLTERGRELAKELRQLRRSEASMGARHPLMPQVRKQIEAVKEQIAAWSPRVQQFSEDKSSSVADALAEMNEQDLRQLVLRMAGKLSQLEQRVESLERQMEIH